MHIYLLILIVSLVPLFVAGTLRNRLPRWCPIVIPPLVLVPLIWVPIDLMTAPIWIFAFVAFVFSVLSLIARSVIIVVKWCRNKQLPDSSATFGALRPLLVVSLYLFAYGMTKLSLRSANVFAARTALEIQAICDANGLCPKEMPGWQDPYEDIGGSDTEDNSTRIVLYGAFGAKYKVTYNMSNHLKTFSVNVRHNIDESFCVRGGVEKELTASFFAEDGSISEIDIRNLIRSFKSP